MLKPIPTSMLNFLRAIIRSAGIRPRLLCAALRGWPKYLRDRRTFRSLSEGSAWTWGRELPVLTEWSESSGSVGAYFLQDLTVARWIRDDDPARHVDVGSRLDGFIGNLASFREVEVIDIRPQRADVPGVVFHQLDLMAELPPEWQESTDSLSCLHTIEHFGLGRYGDAIDPDGHLKGLTQLKRMVKPGGRLYLSTPIGPQRVEFNAHRIFPAAALVDWFGEGWEIERFAVIDDSIRLMENMDWQGPGLGNHFGCLAGVGLVTTRKLS